MAKKTRRQALIDWFTVNGYEDVTSTTRASKYIVFQGMIPPETKYYIGRNGALRVGRNVASSLSATGTPRYNAIVADGMLMNPEKEEK